MNIRVKLTYLDKIKNLAYLEISPVLLNNNPNKGIGICKIFTDEFGKHFADLDLDDSIDEEWYFYYIEDLKFNDGIYHFNGLSLSVRPLHDKPTTQLKEMIV